MELTKEKTDKIIEQYLKQENMLKFTIKTTNERIKKK